MNEKQPAEKMLEYYKQMEDENIITTYLNKEKEKENEETKQKLKDEFNKITYIEYELPDLNSTEEFDFLFDYCKILGSEKNDSKIYQWQVMNKDRLFPYGVNVMDLMSKINNSQPKGANNKLDSIISNLNYRLQRHGRLAPTKDIARRLDKKSDEQIEEEEGENDADIELEEDINNNNEDTNNNNGANNPNNIKNIITKDNIIYDNKEKIHCTSCHNLQRKKSIDFLNFYNKIKNINPNIDGKYNFNDREGYYVFQKGHHLNYRYEMIGLLGKGTFGEAVQCYDHKTKEVVCIKIINARKDFQAQAMVEIKILTSISLNDTENESGNVKLYQYFNFRSHICLVFELLGQNLFELLQMNNFLGLDLSMIKNYTTELLFSLMFLRKLKIIHCDLKPENILLVPKSKNKIKIIDFGSSCFEYEITYTYIQSRFYRAPEVILDLGYGFEIDIWSMGCILSELYTGNPIFPGSDEMEQINYIMKCLGPPDESLKKSSFKSRFFFDSEINPNYEEFENRKKFSIKEIKNNLKRFFNSYTNTYSGSFREESPQFVNFVDFISRCLEWDQKKRITPEEGLLHPFIIDNLSKEQINNHKMKIKKIKNKIANNEILISKEKEKLKELSISSITFPVFPTSSSTFVFTLL